MSAVSVPPAFQPPPRLLMGPGPSDVAPSVLKAMSLPLVGHLDPTFVKLMEEIKVMLRVVFQTQNAMTFPVSGTGSAGILPAYRAITPDGDSRPLFQRTGSIHSIVFAKRNFRKGVAPLALD